MYIVNAAGITHSIPDDWKLPTGARKATDAEIAAYEGAGAPASAPAAAAPVELVNAIAERDAEIARLQAELVVATAKAKKQ
ncbi:MAG: hypothetical protein U0350_36340 [Caldilineaceae bacterium]